MRGYTAVDDVKLNGKLTLGENTADNGGLRIALMAYLASAAAQPPKTLDGFTPEQRVFLGWAQVWCENRAPGVRAPAGADQPALARPLPRQRRGRRTCRSSRRRSACKAGRADGARRRVPRLVRLESVDRSGHCRSMSRRSCRSSAADDQLADGSRQRGIVACERCPRLRAYCQRIGREKRRAFRDDDLLGAAGARASAIRSARLLIVGLAPAAHGANRTGRVFTGDGVGGSGDFLMAALHRAGFANIPTSQHPDDGLTLRDAFIAAAVRCAPPDNKPTPEEIANCLPHLEAEIDALPRVRVVVALGTDRLRRLSAAAEAPRRSSCGRGRSSATRSSPSCRTARR